MMKYFSKKNGSCTSFDDLPDDLVINILSRLPVKTVVQLICINKLWYSLIKNPLFLPAHLNSFILIITEPFSTSFIVFSDTNHVITRHPNINIPFQTRSETYEIVGACNGLICLTDSCAYKDHGQDFYLLNPFIHKYKKIGVESSCYPDLIDKIYVNEDGDESGQIWVSFWYCEIEKDYKIFRTILLYAGEKKTVASTGFEIYSLNSGNWKVIEGTDALDNFIKCSSTFVNGCLYWLTSSSLSLQCYDLKEKELYGISFPTTVQPVDNWTCFLDKDGSVAIACTKNDSSNNTYTIYLYNLEKGIDGQLQWNKLLCLENDAYVYEKYMGFSANGRLMFIDCNEDGTYHIVAVDLDKPSAVEKLALDLDELGTMEFNVWESLVLFSG